MKKLLGLRSIFLNSIFFQKLDYVYISLNALSELTFNKIILIFTAIIEEFKVYKPK